MSIELVGFRRFIHLARSDYSSTTKLPSSRSNCYTTKASSLENIRRTFFNPGCPAFLLLALTAGLAGYGVAVSQEWPEGIIFCVVLIASNNGSEILQGLKSRASNVLNLLSVIANGGKGGEK